MYRNTPTVAHEHEPPNRLSASHRIAKRATSTTRWNDRSASAPPRSCDSAAPPATAAPISYSRWYVTWESQATLAKGTSLSENGESGSTSGAPRCVEYHSPYLACAQTSVCQSG